MDSDAASQPCWQQVSINFGNYAAAEDTVATYLGPILIRAEDIDLVACWFFIRKSPTWRLRFLPSPDSTAEASALLQQHLDTLHDAAQITSWAKTIYEPEVYAFGGLAGMELAHRVFYDDSRQILAYLANDRRARSAGCVQRRELSMLLCSLLMRSAAQDWYEQGDIWARVAEHRSLPVDTSRERLRGMEPELRKLLTVDAGPNSTLVTEGGSLAFLADWATAFTDTGMALGEYARNGTLRRGLRAVLAHHILFHWNRLGLSSTTQGILAHVAKAVILDQ